MDNGDDRDHCEICGKCPEDHAELFGKCYPDRNSYYTPIEYVTVPASFIDKVREMCDTFRIVTRTHTVDAHELNAVDAVREALAEIDKEE